jgi:hypothetical protein
MTDIGSGRGGHGGPPWSVDLLADLQAGVLDPETAAELWARVEADPEARAIVDALETTRADLRGLADVPPVPMPAEFAARLDAALETEARAAHPVATMAPPSPMAPAGPGQVVDLAAPRRRRNRLVGWGAGLVTVAAAAVGIAVVGIPATSPTDGSALPAPGADAPNGDAANPPLAFKAEDLGGTQLEAARGANDFGPFTSPAKRAGCFEANGIKKEATPIGGRQVVVDGKPGTLFVLSSGLGEFRLIAVEPTCAAGNPAVLADRVVGGVKPTR